MADEKEEYKYPPTGLPVLGIEEHLLKYFRRAVV